jgi:hypothetical protein
MQRPKSYEMQTGEYIHKIAPILDSSLATSSQTFAFLEEMYTYARARVCVWVWVCVCVCVCVCVYV